MGENWKTGLGDNWEVGDSSKDSQYSDGIFYRIKIWDYSHSESGRSGNDFAEGNSIRANHQIGHDGQVDVSRNFVNHQKTQRENANQNGLEWFLPSVEHEFQKNQGKKG